MVRSLTSQLSPPALTELGLAAALRWLCAEIEHGYGLETVLFDDGAEKLLTKAQSAIVFRAVRELLINVARHAKVSRVSVNLQSQDDKLTVTVADEGVGIGDVEKAIVPGRGYGLASVRERMSYLGGAMHIRSVLGGGVTVTLEVVLDPASDRAHAVNA